MGTLFISLCSPARVVAFHAGCTTAMAAIVNILAAISCFVLLERSNTFCRHCCPVMGKNFCDRKSQVTWSTHPLALKKASSARSKNIENCFPSFFLLLFATFHSTQDLYLLLFLLNSPRLSSFFGMHFRSFLYSPNVISMPGPPFFAAAVSPPHLYLWDCIEIRVPRCARMVFGSCKYFIDYYPACS